jgi:hypothetical protein
MAAGLLALPFFLASLFYSVSIALFWGFFRKTRMPEESLPRNSSELPKVENE